ncbi:hypothetical protein CERSUDRAFT_97019 [Gelatoporia subvermispora B]|uniref:SUN domain-containing protein n=1 Tax=Ceriporiopsis subvermispora (strain B) TaxID=914234 RepID=M2QDI6_CERS8|nr:hypothetical protein CERSUDRAFT_97019 [Gelatoporia subvermispora B]
MAAMNTCDEEFTAISPALHAAIQEAVNAAVETCRMDFQAIVESPVFKAALENLVVGVLTSGYHGIFKSGDNDLSIAIDADVYLGKFEHLPSEIAIDIGQAPKHMMLWGVVDGKSNTHAFRQLVASELPGPDHQAPAIAKDLLWAPLTSFTYDITVDEPVQTFPVHQQYVKSGITFGVVVLEVLKNWESDSTCLYRVMLHGNHT